MRTLSQSVSRSTSVQRMDKEDWTSRNSPKNSNDYEDPRQLFGEKDLNPLPLLGSASSAPTALFLSNSTSYATGGLTLTAHWYIFSPHCSSIKRGFHAMTIIGWGLLREKRRGGCGAGRQLWGQRERAGHSVRSWVDLRQQQCHHVSHNWGTEQSLWNWI